MMMIEVSIDLEEERDEFSDKELEHPGSELDYSTSIQRSMPSFPVLDPHPHTTHPRLFFKTYPIHSLLSTNLMVIYASPVFLSYVANYCDLHVVLS